MRILPFAAAFFLVVPVSRAEDAFLSTRDLEKQSVSRAVEEYKAEIERLKARVAAGERASAALQPLSTEDAEFDIDDILGGDVQAKIVNGNLTTRYPSVGHVLYVDDGKAGSWCSGTLIGCRTVLTAQHCVEDDATPSSYRVYFQHAGVFDVISVATYSPYDFPSGDLAILTLDRSVEGIRPSPIHEGNAVSNGAEGRIVGFGRTGGSRGDYGLKRVGTIKTASCRSAYPDCVCWNFDSPIGAPGDDSNTCNADSGGPLLIRPPSGSARRLAGVTSGGTRSSCLVGDHAYDVDVRLFATWIRQTTGADLGEASCGTLPKVGTSRVTSKGRIVDVAAGESKEIPLAVPAGLTRLRIGMNGEDRETAAGETNFDLYVHREGDPAGSTSECKQMDKSQVGFCEMLNPQAGSWIVRVVQAGPVAGTAQLVATMFEP